MGIVDILSIALGCVASVLGALKYSQVIPVVFAFASANQILIAYFNPKVHLNQVNAAIACLHELQLQWDGSSNMERRTPAFKEKMIQRTEDMAVSVLQAWLGSKAAWHGDDANDKESSQHGGK